MAFIGGDVEADPEDLDSASQFLGEVYPDAAMILPGDRGKAVNLRYSIAGFGIAEVIFQDGSARQAPYVKRQTRYTKAIERIFEAEIDGLLPEGSHMQAMDDIGNGEFYLRWDQYLK